MTRDEERQIAASLGEGPLAMFDDGCPLKFLRGLKLGEATDAAKPSTQKENSMSKLSELEDEWQRRATGEAVASARKVAKEFQSGLLMPIGRLGNHEWSIIVTAAISGWISVRTQQAIEENRDAEETTRLLDLNPTPQDIGVVQSILGELADKAKIDWSLPLEKWSKNEMLNFLMLAWRLLNRADLERDHGAGGSRTVDKAMKFDERVGDLMPF